MRISSLPVSHVALSCFALLLFAPSCCAHALAGCTRISQRFTRTSWLGIGPTSEIWALRNVTCSFASDGLTALVGPSGSGKSALVKAIHALSSDAREGNSPVSGVFLPASSTESQGIATSYLDPLFHLTYDASLPARDILVPATSKVTPASPLSGDETHRQTLLASATALASLPLSTRASSLLESERRMLEILLSLHRLRGPSTASPIILLDEYLDKDSASVKLKVAAFLRALCAHPDVRLQVVLVTHSRGAMDCADWCVALNGGRLFHEGKPGKIQKPAQLLMLD